MREARKRVCFFIDDKEEESKRKKEPFQRTEEEKDTKGIAEALLSVEEASYLHWSLSAHSSPHTDTAHPHSAIHHCELDGAVPH